MDTHEIKVNSGSDSGENKNGPKATPTWPTPPSHPGEPEPPIKPEPPITPVVYGGPPGWQNFDEPQNLIKPATSFLRRMIQKICRKKR